MHPCQAVRSRSPHAHLPWKRLTGYAAVLFVFEGSGLILSKCFTELCCKQSVLDRMQSCPSSVVKGESSDTEPWRIT